MTQKQISVFGPGAPMRLDVEITTVRGELIRVDTKAGLLLTLASAGLSGGLAVLGIGRLTGAAAVAGWITVGLITAGVLLLGASVWPRLPGGHGLMLWAAAADAEDLARELTIAARWNEANGLLELSRAARGKYRQIQAGMTALGLALVAAIVATALATWR